MSGEGTALLRGLIARDAKAELSGDGSIVLTATRASPRGSRAGHDRLRRQPCARHPAGYRERHDQRRMSTRRGTRPSAVGKTGLWQRTLVPTPRCCSALDPCAGLHKPGVGLLGITDAGAGGRRGRLRPWAVEVLSCGAFDGLSESWSRSMASASRCRRGGCSVLSVATGRARRRRCGSSAGCWRRMPAA